MGSETQGEWLPRLTSGFCLHKNRLETGGLGQGMRQLESHAHAGEEAGEMSLVKMTGFSSVFCALGVFLVGK